MLYSLYNFKSFSLNIFWKLFHDILWVFIYSLYSFNTILRAVYADFCRFSIISFVWINPLPKPCRALSFAFLEINFLVFSLVKWPLHLPFLFFDINSFVSFDNFLPFLYWLPILCFPNFSFLSSLENLEWSHESFCLCSSVFFNSRSSFFVSAISFAISFKLFSKLASLILPNVFNTEFKHFHLYFLKQHFAA